MKKVRSFYVFPVSAALGKFKVFILRGDGMDAKDARADAMTAVSAEFNAGAGSFSIGPSSIVESLPEIVWPIKRADGWAWIAKQ